MRQQNIRHLAELFANQEPPCVSLYQPTHRCHPENQQDPIRYRNLLKQMEETLLQKYPTREVRSFVDQFQAYARDDHFWKHRTSGLAMLASGNSFQMFELQRPVEELLIVADSFHTKPLIRAFQSADRYQILGLSRTEATLYEGNRYELDPVDVADLPMTINQALGEELTEPYQSVGTYGKMAHGRGWAMHYGQGQKKDEVDIDTERFFRAIDRMVLEHHSRPTELPLLLAALPEYQTKFHKISHNPFLMGDGITANPEALSLDQLRTEAWRILEPIYVQRLEKLIDDYRVARARDLGADRLEEVAQAVVAGRVGTLLVEDNRQIPGKLNRASGKVIPPNGADALVDDVLDDLAEMVLKMKGEVVVVPSEKMPTKTGVLATFRF